jgi:hypothetical protein
LNAANSGLCGEIHLLLCLAWLPPYVVGMRLLRIKLLR